MTDAVSKFVQRTFGADLAPDTNARRRYAEDLCLDGHRFIRIQGEMNLRGVSMWIVCQTCGAREQMQRAGNGWAAKVPPNTIFRGGN